MVSVLGSASVSGSALGSVLGLVSALALEWV